ncbi:MAG: hypothetical protein KDC71_22450 [Acidobacteria bacterium]|nr:hypothetical protein [Acidobacteriota bacterium]
MAQTKAQFCEGLCQSHFEECSFLWDSLDFYQLEPLEIPTPTLLLEARFHQHLWALKAEGGLAQRFAQDKIVNGDRGERITAILLMGPDLFQRLDQVEELDRQVLAELCLDAWTRVPVTWSQFWTCCSESNQTDLLPSLLLAAMRNRQIAFVQAKHVQVGDHPYQLELRSYLPGAQILDFSSLPEETALACQIRAGQTLRPIGEENALQWHALLMGTPIPTQDLIPHLATDKAAFALLLWALHGRIDSTVLHKIAENSELNAYLPVIYTLLSGQMPLEGQDLLARLERLVSNPNQKDATKMRFGRSLSAESTRLALACGLLPNIATLWLNREYRYRFKNDTGWEPTQSPKHQHIIWSQLQTKEEP